MSARVFQPRGVHVLADCEGVAACLLTDRFFWERHTRAAATLAGAQILRFEAHEFGPEQGLAGVLLLAESHLSFHTWPEHGFVALDAFMCGNCRPRVALEYLCEVLCCPHAQFRELARGRP